MSITKLKLNEKIIQEFIQCYKYECDCIEINPKNGEKNISLLINGNEYHCHYLSEDNSYIQLNNFLVSSQIIKAVKDDYSETSIFKSDKEYDELFNTFKYDLKQIGVTFYKHSVGKNTRHFSHGMNCP